MKTMKHRISPKAAMKKVTAEIVHEGTPLDQINDGFCYEWAEGVLELLRESKHEVELWETNFDYADTSHAFLRIDGLFYDSACQEGTEDHQQLPCFYLYHSRRQPVWMIDCNAAARPIENIRDMTHEDVLKYNRSNGIGWISDEEYARQHAELAASRRAKGL